MHLKGETSLVGAATFVNISLVFFACLLALLTQVGSFGIPMLMVPALAIVFGAAITGTFLVGAMLAMTAADR